MNREWIGVDFDGTLVTTGHANHQDIGFPIPLMIDRVNNWIAEGKDVRIMTARANHEEEAEKVKDWCKEMFGKDLPVTATKDHNMKELWDDRAVQIIPNTGIRADGQPE